MIKAILFDLGGTLFDFARMDTRGVFEAAGRRTYDYLLSKGHTPPPFRRYFRTSYNSVILSYLWSLVRRREFNVYHLLPRVCRKMKIEIDAATQEELAGIWYQPCMEQSSVADDVIPSLRKFQERGYRLAIVSNTFIPGFILDRQLARHGLLEFFPHRIYSSEVGRCKPHPLPFELALRAVDATPDHAIFVGDTVRTDILGARRLGIRTVLRQVNGKARSHFLADHVIRSISDLHPILPAIPATPTEELPPLEDLAYEA